jgi:hypothetical protein
MCCAHESPTRMCPWASHMHRKKNTKQAGAELCQAQAQVGFTTEAELILRSSSTSVVFQWGLLLLMLSSNEVVFHLGRLPQLNVKWRCQNICIHCSQILFHLPINLTIYLFWNSNKIKHILKRILFEYQQGLNIITILWNIHSITSS